MYELQSQDLCEHPILYSQTSKKAAPIPLYMWENLNENRCSVCAAIQSFKIIARKWHSQRLLYEAIEMGTLMSRQLCTSTNLFENYVKWVVKQALPVPYN